MRKRYKALFLIFAIFGVYYPALFSGFNLVDDVQVFGGLDDAEGFDILGLLKAAGGDYYRPLTTLTFFFDKVLWALEPSFMHVENIALHAANALLVFLIAEKVFAALKSEKYELPLLSSLLFGLHPVNTEAVNWISGRYDLLATLFVLVAALLLLLALKNPRQKYFVLSAAVLFIGCFAKESAVFFFPVAAFLVFTFEERPSDLTAEMVSPKIRKWKQIIPFIVSCAAFLLIRSSFFKTGSDGGFGSAAARITQGMIHNVSDSVRILLKVFGFYIKKLFVPVPLNFAIVTISDIYVWVGLLFLIVAVFLFFRRNAATDFFVASLFLISSGIAVVFARAAWTPVAERYIYLTSAFFSIGVTGTAFLLFKRYRKEAAVTASLLTVIVAAAFITAERTVVWQDNLALYQDTVRKSPEFTKLNNELAGALKEHGLTAEADALLEAAKSENPSHAFLYVNQADLRLNQGKPDEARKIILKSFRDKETANPEALKMLARIDEARFAASGNKSESVEIAGEIIDTLDHIYPKTHDPFCLYRAGQLSLYTGKKQKAGEYFLRAYEKSPEHAYFKKAAKKLAENINGNINIEDAVDAE